MKWAIGIGVAGLMGLALWAAPWWRERQYQTARHALDLAEAARAQAQQQRHEAEQALHDARTRQQSYETLVATQAELKAQLKTVASQTADVQASLKMARQELNAAVAQVRALAHGWHLVELELMDGRKLREATVQHVKPEGVVFTHAKGEVTVHWRSLPLDLLERFFPEEAIARAGQQRASFATKDSSDEPAFGPDDLDAPPL